MAISLVGTTSGSNATGADVVISLTGLGLAQNDVVCVFGNAFISSDVSTAGYTKVTVGSSKFAYKKMGASPDSSVTGVGSGSSTDASTYVVMAFRGVDTTTAIDATTTTATGSSSQPNSPSITTVTNGAAVITFVRNSKEDTSVTAPTGYGNTVSQPQTASSKPRTVAGAWKVIPSAGAEDPAPWSGFNQSINSWDAASVALRPAASGTFGDGVLSATGTATVTFKSDGIASSVLAQTGTATVSWVGSGTTQNPAPFSMTGTGTATFVGGTSNSGVIRLTGTATVSFVGGKILMTSILEVVEPRGATTVTVH